MVPVSIERERKGKQGAKRKNEEIALDGKKAKTKEIMREKAQEQDENGENVENGVSVEKENTKKHALPAHVLNPVETSHGSSVVGINKRKLTSPVKLENIPKTLETCTDHHELMELFEKHKDVDGCRFLLHNVTQKKNIINKKAKCSHRVMPKIEAIQEDLMKKMNGSNNNHTLCTLKFDEIKNWAMKSDLENFATNSACITSFVLLVDADDAVHSIANGLTTITFKDPGLNRDIFYIKNATVTKEEIENVKFIYYAVIVKRKTCKSQKRVAQKNSLRTNEKSKVPLTPLNTLEEQTLYGCIRMYEKNVCNEMDNGLSRIVLVEKEDPKYERVFSGLSDDEPTAVSMMSAENLKILNGANRTTQDAHLPQLLFESKSPNFGNSINLVECLPDDETMNVGGMEIISKDRKTSNSIGMVSRFVQNIGDHESRAQRFHSRFPCFILLGRSEAATVIPAEEYFQENSVRNVEDSYCYRIKKHRSIQLPKINAAANRKRENKKIKSGISASNYNFIKTKYINRSKQMSELGIQWDGPKAKKQHFALNNAPLFDEVEKFWRESQDIPERYRLPGSEMYVVHVPLSDAEIKSFNERLASCKNENEGGNKCKRKPSEEYGPRRRDADLDGRQIPRFSELFFPQVKSDKYNSLLRYFLADMGYGAGSRSAEYKSLILTNFVTRNFEQIFSYELGNIFEKHIQLVALSTPGWTSKLYEAPRDKYFELKKVWEEMQKIEKPRESQTGTHRGDELQTENEREDQPCCSNNPN